MENEEKVTEQKENQKKPSRKKTIILYSSIVMVAVALGVTAGVLAKLNMSKETTDYSGFNPEQYRVDSKELLEQYKANPRKIFTAAELINIGLEKYRQCENSYSIGVGNADAGIVNQTIRNAQIKNGNKYFEESISNSSMVHIANRVEQTDIGGKIYFYKGKATGAEACKYTDNKVEYAEQDYKKEWGKTLDEMFIYLISNDTVLKDSDSIENTDDGLIKIKVSLDTDISSYYYKVQMKTISKLSGLPTFDYLKQSYVFTSDMKLLYCQVDEKYQASMGPITTSIHNIIDYYYHADEYQAIPTLEERINYSLEGEVKYE